MRFAHEFPGKDVRKKRLNSALSAWWSVLDHPFVYDERSSAGQRFRRKFRVPRCVFDDLLKQLRIDHPEWDELKEKKSTAHKVKVDTLALRCSG